MCEWSQDVDGSNITSLLLEFFFTFLPELIESGRVYKAISPLYKIDTYSIRKYYKGDYWKYSKKELYDVFNIIVINNISMGTKEKDGTFVELSKREMKHFLEINSEYLMEYDMFMARTSGHEVVLEYAAYYRYLYGKNLGKFKQAIEKKFPEVEFDVVNQTIIGSYKGDPVSLFIDDLFDSIAKRMNKLFAQNDFFEFYYKNKNDENGVYELTTIGGFFRTLKPRYNVSVSQRFKGLGEADPELLFLTTINPKFRRLVRLKVSNKDETRKMLDLFHGKKTENREGRRKIVMDSNISYADIDN